MEYLAVKKKTEFVLHLSIWKDFHNMGRLRTSEMMDTNSYGKL